MPDVFVLDVRLHGKSIGTITRLADDRTIFTFSEAYIAARDAWIFEQPVPEIDPGY